MIEGLGFLAGAVLTWLGLFLYHLGRVRMKAQIKQDLVPLLREFTSLLEKYNLAMSQERVWWRSRVQRRHDVLDNLVQSIVAEDRAMRQEVLREAQQVLQERP
jgi:hypothetical protein